MSAARHFPASLVQEFDSAKIIGIRAGKKHGYTGVWVVVVKGRVFVRSWNDKLTGWFRAFLEEPVGASQLPDQEVRVRARHARGQKLQEAVSEAYGRKYPTKASEKWVKGFAEPQRMVTTLELLPV